MLWGILVALAALYLGALILLYTMQRKIVFHPDPALAAIADYPAPRGLETVTNRTADGLDIVSWYLPPARPDGRTIAYFHGNAGHHGGRVERIVPYAAAGYGILLVGYRGYGGNPGDPTEEGLYADARAALDFLQGQDVKADRLILFGESLGAAVATQMAIERPARAVILEAPFASILRSARQRYRYLAFDALVRDKFDTLSKIDRIGKPLLLIHGDLDRTTPAYFGRMVFDAAKEPKQGFFPAAAGHNDLMQHGMPARVLAFLESLGDGEG
ncbi:alpha/beta hydrolase [Dongia sp.]|uniref:alpha/beta hydrolase n=1 Tax=Dongia sp. TaxID=1977262 RepID=UPI0035B34573